MYFIKFSTLKVSQLLAGGRSNAETTGFLVKNNRLRRSRSDYNTPATPPESNVIVETPFPVVSASLRRTG